MNEDCKCKGSPVVVSNVIYVPNNPHKLKGVVEELFAMKQPLIMVSNRRRKMRSLSTKSSGNGSCKVSWAVSTLQGPERILRDLKAHS